MTDKTMEQVVRQSLFAMSTMKMKYAPNADDLEDHIRGYVYAFSDNLYSPKQIERRFQIYMQGMDSEWPSPQQIKGMRVSDYVPTSNTGQAQISNDSRRLPLRSETVTAGEYAAEHLKRMREALK